MIQDMRTREKILLDVLNFKEEDLPRQLDWYINRYHKVNRGSILSGISTLHECRALKAYFINDNPNVFRQQSYMSSILQVAAYAAGFNEGVYRGGSTFLYALLSDSPECISQIACAELTYKNDPKDGHFYLHMQQLLLLDDHAAITDMIALGAKKCGKPLRDEFADERDFFSLFLLRDKTALEAHIYNLTKVKDENVVGRDFFSHWAVICSKLCWIKGIEVEINHPLIPMGLMPVRPLPHYEIEYDFLRPGWEPPKDDLLSKIKSWLK